MNDYRELIERLRTESLDSRNATLPIMDLCMDAAGAIETLTAQLTASEAARAELGKRLAKVEQELAQVKAERSWISVKDRLPSEADLVTGRYHSLIIVCDKDGEVGFTYWDCGLGMRNEDVAYWMPLPEPPEEGTV